MSVLIGQSSDPNVPAVFGENTGDGGSGVFGRDNSEHGGGVIGHSDNGRGVYGESPAGTGVWGWSKSKNGVVGESQDFEGVRGLSHSVHGAVVGINDGTGAGVYGESNQNEGVRGVSHSVHGGVVGSNDGAGVGVYGESNQNEGVRGISHSAHGGVVGTNDGTGAGVWGQSNQNEGVHGETNSETFAAVAGIMLNPSGTGAGVYGESRGRGPAGFFQGDVHATGKIDCPKGTVNCFDMTVSNADCAEEFEILALEQIEPGTVMVINEDDSLRESRSSYDKRVAGVISGAGDLKPGITLNKQQSLGIRMPIALIGKVYCKVDAQYSAIALGDPLTTSPTPGHAMKATDHSRAFGAVIGKALRPLPSGQGLIPVLVALQ
jgi:hypothetical protein